MSGLVASGISDLPLSRSCSPAAKTKRGKDAGRVRSRRLRTQLRTRPRAGLQRAGECEMRWRGSSSRASLDQDVCEDRAQQAVEDDGLGEREAEPLDALELTAELGLARDRLAHRAEGVPDAAARAEGAETDAEGEAAGLAGVRAVPGGGAENG